jgi:hypothetical protein
MITGEDSVVVVAAADLSEVVDRMLTLLAVRWPSAVVSVNDGERQHDFGAWGEWVGRLPRIRGDVMVARDPEMQSMWETEGYFIDAAGEGPLTIYYEPCKAEFLAATFRAEPYIREAGYGFDPFDGLILGTGCSVLTLVSPEDSGQLRDDVLDLLRSTVADLSTGSATDPIIGWK